MGMESLSAISGMRKLPDAPRVEGQHLVDAAGRTHAQRSALGNLPSFIRL